MRSTIQAKKLKMTQLFKKDGRVVPVTLVKLKDGSLSSGDLVDVSGKSKGKGFAGVVKRWGFADGPKTHGQSDKMRAPGSIGAGTDPGRVWKGKKMPGRKGGKRVTVKNLEVVGVNEQDGIAAIKGAVPGGRNNGLKIRKVDS